MYEHLLALTELRACILVSRLDLSYTQMIYVIHIDIYIYSTYTTQANPTNAINLLNLFNLLYFHIYIYICIYVSMYIC
jgi:hypothetical protein